MTLRNFAASIPVLGGLARHVKSTLLGDKVAPFTTSHEYWERRYHTGGNSGAGSYNNLARFKANFINDFAAANQIRSVIEFGSGDGAQLRLARYEKYLGVDVSSTIVAQARTQFSDRPELSFVHSSEFDITSRADLTLSLDVIYHLVEDDVYDMYMSRLFDTSSRFVIIYSSNGSPLQTAAHVRHRKFTDWVEAHRQNFRLEFFQPNAFPYDVENPETTSFADFYVYRHQ